MFALYSVSGKPMVLGLSLKLVQEFRLEVGPGRGRCRKMAQASGSGT